MDDTRDNAQERLDVICEMIEDQLKFDMLVSSQNFLVDLLSVGRPEKEKSEDFSRRGQTQQKQQKIIISTDASISENPGGIAAVGIVFDQPDQDTHSFSKYVPSKTSNQAEYDAIYEGLVTFFNLNNNPGMPVEVRSDSQIAIRQLNEEMKCRSEELIKKRDAIWELTEALPVEVEFVWRPRCSTPSMKLADKLAYEAVQATKEK
jgi:ribonuclease HI